jgi:hypothetical protein
MRISTEHPRARELSFQRLLGQRIAELQLKPDGTLRQCLIQLRRELKGKHIAYYPHFYFGDEPWGCVDRTGSIEIPFFLANNDLRRLSERYYLSYSKEEIMMTLRHETGHAIIYAYKLWRREDWKATFGKFHKPYRSFYHYDPFSKDFVRYLHYLGNPHYAQKHPDEDFAETFAVWLDPESKWKWNYRDWAGALRKLNFVDRLFRVERVAERRPMKVRHDEESSYKKMDLTVAEYFGLERKVDPRIKEYTSDLKQIFSGVGPRTRKAIRADMFIQNYKGYLENELVTWLEKADRRDVRKYLRELQIICALSGLRLHPDQSTEKLVELVIVSTYHVLNRLKRIR